MDTGSWTLDLSPLLVRFQHSCIFLDSKLLIVGGRGPEVNKPGPRLRATATHEQP